MSLPLIFCESFSIVPFSKINVTTAGVRAGHWVRGTSRYCNDKGSHHERKGRHQNVTQIHPRNALLVSCRPVGRRSADSACPERQSHRLAAWSSCYLGDSSG